MSRARFSVFIHTVVLLILLLSISGCATGRKPLEGLVPGREVETINSSIGLSAQTGEQTTSGRGYLLFKKPDRFHIAILSPFGMTLLDLYGEGDRLTALVPSKQAAYRGLLSELPETSALRSLALLRWVVAPPAAVVELAGQEMVSPAGDRFYFDENGLLQRKVSQLGDEVAYRDYRSIEGAGFPESIVIASRFGATLKISFEDTEINQPVDDSALVPALEGYRVLPLAEFKGM